MGYVIEMACGASKLAHSSMRCSRTYVGFYWLVARRGYYYVGDVSRVKSRHSKISSGIGHVHPSTFVSGELLKLLTAAS